MIYTSPFSRCLAAALAAVSLLFIGCSGPPASEAPDGRLSVVATTTIVADLLRSVGGDDLQVISLMGAGVDPHLYKPSAGDVRRMSEAKAVFYNGLHLEGKMAEVLEEMNRRGTTTVAVAEGVPPAQLITTEGYANVHDPHVWFDVGLWIGAAQKVRDALAEIDPDNAAAYGERAASYIAELEELDHWVGGRVAEIPEQARVLVTAHDAFAYFGRAYGLEVRGLLGVSTAAEAGTNDVQELAELIASRKIPAIFVETSVSSRYVQALQEAVQARGFEVVIGGTLYSDALGDPGTEAATYVGTVRTNVNTIVAALAAGDDAHE